MDTTVPVVIVAKDHPATTGLTDFTIQDEIQWGCRVQHGVTPLITTPHPKSRQKRSFSAERSSL